MKTEDILNEREKTHGDFGAVSAAWADLTTTFDEHYKDSCVVLNDRQAAAIKMIFLKIARIVCGDANFADHWDDIAGYAKLGRGKEEKFSIIDDPNIEELCVICNDNIKEDNYKYMWRLENKYLCRHCLMRLKEVPESVKDSTNSKMEHEKEDERSLFERTWLPRCSICKGLLPPKPDYHYLDGKGVHTGCYTEAISKMETTEEECACYKSGCEFFPCAEHFKEYREKQSMCPNEDEWYDAEKCLPLPRRKITARIKGNDFILNHTAELHMIDGDAFITLTNNKLYTDGRFEILKWKYAD